VERRKSRERSTVNCIVREREREREREMVKWVGGGRGGGWGGQVCIDPGGVLYEYGFGFWLIYLSSHCMLSFVVEWDIKISLRERLVSFSPGIIVVGFKMFFILKYIKIIIFIFLNYFLH
jgi:hypothetical protein